MELIITEKIKAEHLKNTDPTLCLNMIVKNESKIITRMFDAVIDLIDCYCICDTGSTDNTIELIMTYFIEKGIPGKIIQEPFKNFAHNRNVALQACKGMSAYVLLLDADMILHLEPFTSAAIKTPMTFVGSTDDTNYHALEKHEAVKVSEKFVKNSLKDDFYYIFQGNEAFYYQNIRIVRNNGLFTYVGVTHEHINVPPGSVGGIVFEKQAIFIHDIGDGGAKNDKFKRDISLLEQGLVDEPHNTRYVFYLGNSYRDNGDYDKAIETYKKQLLMPAWNQEKYCACLSIGNIYFKKGDKDNAAKFWLKTSEYDTERIEGIINAMDYYRQEGENVLVNCLYHKYKDYKRNLAEGKLFVEQPKYCDVLEYNNSIAAYYANDKESGYACCKQILLRGVMDRSSMLRTLDNLIFYKDFLSKDTQEERAKLFTCVDKLLDENKLNMKKSENEIWRMLNSDIKGEDSIKLTEISLEKPTEMNLEKVYQQIKVWRIQGKSQEALELYNSISKEHSKYKEYLWQLAYEYSVFAYYTGIRNINEQVVTILNKCEEASVITGVLSNLKFYPDVLKAEKVYDFTFTLKHQINEVEYNFNSSSSCIIPYKDGYLLNIRLVNYQIDSEGGYGGYDKHIISLYKTITLSKDFTKLAGTKLAGTKLAGTNIVETLIDVNYIDRRYIGIEDIKIFQESASDSADKILFTGTGYHNDNSVGVVCGQYSEVNYVCGKPLNALEIKPAFNLHSGCEKNWTFVTYKGETHMIYSWFPLKICKINKNTGNLDLVEERTMPAIFKRARGSSCASKHTAKCSKVENWFVVHLVSYEKPRYYYHMLVVLDNNMDLLRYSAPFKFEGECIEYCIGLIVEAERVIIPYSTMDRTTKVAVYSKEYIDSKMVYYNNIMNFTKDDTKTQILSTVQTYNVLCNKVLCNNVLCNNVLCNNVLCNNVLCNNVLCNNVLNAVIITGQIRTFEKILKSLVENIVVPNKAVVFICCETDNKENLDKILNKYPEINIGGIITEPSFRNEEFNSIVNMIITSNRKGLSPEVFERARKADGINWNINYIVTSGTIVQYYQFWKIWHILLEYERKNNCKFENIIRTQTDVFISKKINISNVFEEGGYIENLYNKSMLLDNSIYFDKLTNIIYKPYDTIITLATEQVWIGKRTVFDCLSNILFHYGLWDSGHSCSFNSETNFHEFCKNYNIYHIGIQEKEDWPLYFYENDDVNKYLFGICKC